MYNKLKTLKCFGILQCKAPSRNRGIGWMGSFQKEKGVSAVAFAAPSISIIISIARKGLAVLQKGYS